MLLTAAVMLFTVLITVEERVPCAPQDHGLSVKAPGVYERLTVPRGVREPCERTRRVQEEWTDLPERGGRFLRQLRELVE